MVDCIQAFQLLPSSPFEEEYQLLCNLVHPNRISFVARANFATSFKLEATAGSVARLTLIGTKLFLRPVKKRG